MSLVSQAVDGQLRNTSWIRRMFELGIAAKKQYGEDAVCDFTLGNPDLPAPPAVAQGLRELLEKAERPYTFGYMPNGGFSWAREALAKHLSVEQEVSLTGEDVVLTCGAAGALHGVFKTILEPGDEVLAIAPCFGEYANYVGNHGGVLTLIPSMQDDFSPDLASLEKALGPKTRAVIINSPNNPTGQIYSRKTLEAMATVLARQSDENRRPIFLVFDDPYRFLAFDDEAVPAALPLSPYAILASSFSKSLSLPGERVGYVAVSPDLPGREKLVAGFILANRVLGFVNPPVVGQHLMVAALGSQVDVSVYASRREVMAGVLTRSGYDFAMPKGAFYFFPKAPGGDDVAFVKRLLEEQVLAVPGCGFSGPGHFRLTLCVDENIIRRAEDGFKRARDSFPA